jgi:hypothetical protein
MLAGTPPDYLPTKEINTTQPTRWYGAAGARPLNPRLADANSVIEFIFLIERIDSLPPADIAANYILIFAQRFMGNVLEVLRDQLRVSSHGFLPTLYFFPIPLDHSALTNSPAVWRLSSLRHQISRLASSRLNCSFAY